MQPKYFKRFVSLLMIISLVFVLTSCDIRPDLIASIRNASWNKSDLYASGNPDDGPDVPNAPDVDIGGGTVLPIIPGGNEGTGDVTFAYRYNARSQSYSITSLVQSGPVNVVLPSEYNGKPVNSIDGHALSGAGFVSVTVPEGYLSIGEFAFSGCSNLESVSLPSSLINVGNGAFCGTPMKNISLIEGSGKLKLANGHLAQKGGRLLCYVYGNNLPDDGSVKIIGSYSISNPLEHFLDIPSKITEIEAHGIYDCSNLSGISFGKDLKTFAPGAVNSCAKLQDLQVSAENESFRLVSNCVVSNKGAIVLGTAASVIPTDPSITSIGSSAFAGLDDLNGIEIPGNIKIIGSYAFADCINLREIVLHEGIKQMLDYAFSSTSIDRIVIPKSLNYVGMYVFENCHNTTLVYTEQDQILGWGEDWSYGLRNVVYEGN